MYTVMCIIQNILQYYIIETTNIDPLKPKVMKLAYIRKTSFNINGIVIHYEFAIPLNNFFNELNSLNDEKCGTLIKTYDQFQLIMTNEISLVGRNVNIY